MSTQGDYVSEGQNRNCDAFKTGDLLIYNKIHGCTVTAKECNDCGSPRLN